MRIIDPVETRYFRSDSHTVNTVTARKLGLTLSGVGDSVAQSSGAPFLPPAAEIGVRVYVLHVDGTKTELTAAVSAVVSVAYPTAKTLVTATWNAPETDLAATDAILVEVYLNDGLSGWVLADTWITPQLGASNLKAVTWRFYYWVEASYSYSPIIGYYTFGITFYFDGANDSRIANFTYTVVVVPVKKFVGNGLTWWED